MVQSLDISYGDHLIRPPSEAQSIILQPTIGCPHNKCAFCGAYRGLSFRRRSLSEFREHARWVRENNPFARRRVFFADGDSMVLSAELLFELISETKQIFPGLERFSIYGGAKGILSKDEKNLKKLKEDGLNMVYLGLESGSDEVLKMMNKGCDCGEMVEAVQFLQRVGIRASVMILLGLGGREYSSLHVKETVKAINAMQPRFLSALTLMIIPGTELEEKIKNLGFTPLKPIEFLSELKEMVQGFALERTVFSANHASSYLPLKGALPKDKEKLLRELEMASMGLTPLMPEFMRGL